MIRVGVIGYGYWGPNLARNFAETPEIQIAGVSDRRPERLRLASLRYPGAWVGDDPNELIENPKVDAIAVATPVSSHYELAEKALEAGKHVLLEKPMARSSELCEKLIEKAQKHDRVLMVDHTFVYTGAVTKIREVLGNGEVGDIYYYDSVRVNLGTFQPDVNVVWDLAVHDLAIMDCVLKEKPCAVSAAGMSHVAGEPEDIAYLTLFFPGKMMAHVHVNWLAPVKIRRTLIGGSKKMILFDDLEPSEKVRIYDHGITVNEGPKAVYEMRIGYRTGDVWAPRLDPGEALRAEVRHFAECIKKGSLPLTDGAAGARVVRILEAATESMRNGGRMVEFAARG